MKKRGTMRVLVNPARPDTRVDLFDSYDFLIKHRKITNEGLQHTLDGVLERGPVTVPQTPHYRQLVREGTLIVVPE